MVSTRARGTARTRLVLAIVLATAGLAMAACTEDPPPDPGDPTTPWLAAGCIDSVVSGVPDFYFNGVANAASNAHGFATGGDPALSEDGTCTGTPTEYNSIVRAGDAAAAIAACDDLGASVTSPPRLIDFGYNVPIDAWACIDSNV